MYSPITVTTKNLHSIFPNISKWVIPFPVKTYIIIFTFCLKPYVSLLLLMVNSSGIGTADFKSYLQWKDLAQYLVCNWPLVNIC